MKCMSAGCFEEATEVPALWAWRGLCVTCENLIAKNAMQRNLSCEGRLERHCLLLGGVPKSMLSFHPNPIMKTVTSLAERAMHERKGLLLFGPPGVGKTLTLAFLARQIINRGGDLLFVGVGDFAQKMRNTHQVSNGVVMMDEVERVCRVRHLMLDDISAAHDGTGWWTSTLFSIVDRRYKNGFCTSATVNDAEHVHGPLVRRLRETCIVVEMEELT